MDIFYILKDLKKIYLFKSKFLRIKSFTIFILINFLIFFGISFGKENIEEESLEEILSGFDEGESEIEIDKGIFYEDGDIEISNLFGNTGLRLSYSYAKKEHSKKNGTDWSGITKIQTFFSLTFDQKFWGNWKSRISGKVFYDFAFQLQGRENFTQEVLDELEKEAEFRELYIEGSIKDSFDIRIGKQIVVWGVADSFRGVDVLNPRDNREFGITNLEDTRIPINMTRLDYYFGDLKLEAVVVHEIKFNKSAPYGSDFYPANHKIKEVIPQSNSENFEYGIALVGEFRGWDGSLNWADFFDDDVHYKIGSIEIIPGIGEIPNFEWHHSRLNMIGVTLNIASGNYLWKAEAAKFNGIEFARAQEKKFSRLDVILGIEYLGIRDSSFSLESGFQHLYNFDSRLKEMPDFALEENYSSSFSFMQDYFNKTLNLNLSGIMIGKEGKEGGINLATLEYNIFDSFSLKGGLIIYKSGSSQYFKSINDNDRFYFEIRFSF